MLYRDFAIATLLSAACVVDAALIAIEVGKNGVRLFSSSTFKINLNLCTTSPASPPKIKLPT